MITCRGERRPNRWLTLRVSFSNPTVAFDRGAFTVREHRKRFDASGACPQPDKPRHFLRRRFFAFSRGRFARSRYFLNGKVFELRTSLELLSQPDGLRSSACPGVALLVSKFDRHLPALHRASRFIIYRGRPPEGGERRSGHRTVF